MSKPCKKLKKLLKLTGKLPTGSFYSTATGDSDCVRNSCLVQLTAKMVYLFPGRSDKVQLRTWIERDEVRYDSQTLAERSKLSGILVRDIHIMDHAVFKGETPSADTLEIFQSSFQNTQIVCTVNRHERTADSVVCRDKRNCKFDRTLGDLFFAVVDQMEEMSFTEALRLIIQTLFDEIVQIFINKLPQTLTASLKELY